MTKDEELEFGQYGEDDSDDESAEDILEKF